MMKETHDIAGIVLSYPILTALVIVAAVWGLTDAIVTAKPIAQPVYAKKRSRTIARHAAD
jgi:hypothetical protein